MKRLFILLLITSACGTSKTKLSGKGSDITVLSSKPKSECSMLAKIVGENNQGSVELARNHARNLAANEGANSIWIEQEVPNGNMVKVHASAYQCE